MHIAIIGTGYVGLTAGASLAEFGHHVICTDKDAAKIGSLQQGILPIYEPGLDELVHENMASGRLLFSANIGEAIEDSQVVFVSVGTEGLPDGRVNLTAVQEAARQIGTAMRRYTVVVIKSTVPVGTAAAVSRLISDGQLDPVPFDVVSNPEFQREGSAVQDFMRPARVVTGADGGQALAIMREVYRPLHLEGIPFIETTNETAELIKYAANGFLALKVSYINEIANLCDVLGCDVRVLIRALGLDPRIGPKFLNPGPGYGGSCFPKDTRALVRLGEDCGLNLQLPATTVRVNEGQPARVVEKIGRLLGSLNGHTVAVLGLSYKAGTDDVRSSPAIQVCQLLLEGGANLRVYDPVARGNALRVLGDRKVEYCAGAYEAASGAEGIVVLTEWDEFRKLSLHKLRSLLVGNVLVDARNLFDPELAVSAGFIYEGMGSNGSMARVAQEARFSQGFSGKHGD